jgi:hypothetical protein
MLICGHTHRPRFSKYGEPPYFNTGCCIHPRGITCLELIYGDICLVSWRTQSRKDGTLYVKRTVLQGPDPIEIFNQHIIDAHDPEKEDPHTSKRKHKEENIHDRN